MRMEMFPHHSLFSSTVSCFKTPAGIDPAAVVAHMRDHYGILIGTGLDKIRTSTLRVGHMGITSSPMYILPTLSALELTLRERKLIESDLRARRGRHERSLPRAFQRVNPSTSG